MFSRFFFKNNNKKVISEAHASRITTYLLSVSVGKYGILQQGNE
jgi:hypothetical protein